MSTMSVPMLDPRRSYAALREQLDSRLLDVAASGLYVLGPNVAAFEHVARACSSLPVFPELTDAEVEYVASTAVQVIDAA